MNNSLDNRWFRVYAWPEDKTEIKRAFGSAEAVVWHCMYDWSPRKASGG